MKVNDCGYYTLSLLKEYLPRNYKEWEVEFFSSRTIAGICHYERKIIQISTYLLQHSPDSQVQNVVKHEVAHAMNYTYRKCTGHGDWWIYFCGIIGCTTELYTVIDPNYDPHMWKLVKSKVEILDTIRNIKAEDVDISVVPW